MWIINKKLVSIIFIDSLYGISFMSDHSDVTIIVDNGEIKVDDFDSLNPQLHNHINKQKIPIKKKKSSLTTIPIKESIIEFTTGSTTEATTESIIQPIIESTTEFTTESIIPPITESTTELIIEPIIESITESITELIIESTTESTTESITEPIIESITESITEPTTLIREKNMLPVLIETAIPIKEIHSSLTQNKIIIKEKNSDRPLTESEIMDKLLKFQVKHVDQLLQALKKFNTALDGSDTGTGKTYSALALAALLDLSVFVICPKSVISSWRRVAQIFKVKILGIINYESIKMGRYYDEKGVKTVCPYIEVLDKGQEFKWKLPDKTLLVFDEAHKCKNIKSQNARLMMCAKGNVSKILMLSATIADRPQFFANCAYMLDFCNNVKIFNIYLKTLQNMNPNDSIMLSLHKKIFPNKGSRLRIADLGDLFPKNQIVPEAYTMGADIEQQIQEQYELLSVAVQDLKNKEKMAIHPLERIIRARQKIEALKIQTLIELANDYVENGHSVAIFINFKDTLNLLANKLNTNCVVNGEQDLKQRDYCVDSFQDNKQKLIICQIQSGGVGINLHDIHGGHPRVSLISPSWSAGDLIQALGRIHRANGRTHCLQRIIFCANTIEDQICANLQVKINNYSQINDGEAESKIQMMDQNK